MQIAVLSDIHDNIWNLEKVLHAINGKVESIICLGDFCAPFITPKIAALNVPIYACLGNNDEDQIGLLKMGGEMFKWTFLAEEYGQIELGSKKLAYCHYPKLGELLAKTGNYDAVFHGHTHNAVIEKNGRTLLVNPGAICGIQKGKPGEASYAIYNTETNTAEILEIK